MNVSTSPTPLTLSRVLLAVTGHARHVCFHLIDPDIDTMTEMQHHKSLICPSPGGGNKGVHSAYCQIITLTLTSSQCRMSRLLFTIYKYKTMVLSHHRTENM